MTNKITLSISNELNLIIKTLLNPNPLDRLTTCEILNSTYLESLRMNEHTVLLKEAE